MTHLEKKQGFKYTQNKEVEVKDRIVAQEVYLAVNDSESNWKLITDAEAEEIKNQQKAIFEKEEKARMLQK